MSVCCAPRRGHGARLLRFPGLVVAIVATYYIGWWATARYTAGGADHDPSEVVVDEVVGIFIALVPLSAGLWHAGLPGYIFPYPGWIGAFVFFRLFDIWKPGPVGWADRRGGAHGVMLDDVIAGMMAAFCVGALAAFSHLVLMG